MLVLWAGLKESSKCNGKIHKAVPHFVSDRGMGSHFLSDPKNTKDSHEMEIVLGA